MKANLIGILALLAVSGALMLQAEPARCETCFFTGNPCFGPNSCGDSCVCIQPKGPGSQGWCN